MRQSPKPILKRGQKVGGKMKVTSYLAFTHDYSKEFGGNKRLHKHYTTIFDNEPLVNFCIIWDYERPDVYMVDTCIKNKEGRYIFQDCKSRKEAHKWIAENRERILQEATY